MKKAKFGIFALMLGLFTASALAVPTMHVGLADELDGNPVVDKDKNLDTTTEAVTLNYDGSATGYYGVQKYAGVSGPAWIVSETASEATYGKDSHRMGSNRGDGRNGFAVTMKFDSTVEGEATLNLRVKHAGNGESLATLNENGFVTKIDLHLFLNEWSDDCSKDTPVPVTVRKGVNVYTITMCDNYTSWWSSFSLGVISERNTVSNVRDVDSPSNPKSPIIGYFGEETKVYGMLANTKVEGAFWTWGSDWWRCEDGSLSPKIGSNSNERNDVLRMTYTINNYLGDNTSAYLGVFAENHGHHGGFTLKTNGGDPISFDICAMQPVQYNDCIITCVPVTLSHGINTLVMEFPAQYEIWICGFKLLPTFVETMHDYKSVNYDVTKADAIPVDYKGGDSKPFSIQHYAGINGCAWVTGDEVSDIAEGHKVGGNADKVPTEFIFKVNSTVEKAVDFVLYVEQYIGADLQQYKAEVNFDLKVNDADPVQHNLSDLRGQNGSSARDETVIPNVQLKTGLNTIVVKMTASNWKAWFMAFQIKAQIPNYDEISIKDWKNPVGIMSHDDFAIGQNSYDNAADYGKAGSVDYIFKVPTAGKYYLNMAVMAGAKFANRILIKVNGETVMFNEKPYFEAKLDAGWSGDSDNKAVVTLPAGTVTLTIGNYLARVNEDKSAEVEEGGILVSNWWMHGLWIEQIPGYELVLDVSKATTSFNQYRPFTSEGLVVKTVDHSNDDAEKVLTSEEYVIDSSDYKGDVNGTYTIKVKSDKYGVEGSYRVTVGSLEMNPFAGTTLEFDGVHAATQAFYNAEIIGEGTDVCEGRIAYAIEKLPDELKGYKIGSNGAGEWENRQITLKLHINSAVSGKFLLSLALQSEWETNSTYTVKVNDEAEYTTNFFFAFADKPYNMLVNLKQGENVITIRSSNQYTTWFSYYTVAPITYAALNDEVYALNGARWGNDIIDCTNKAFENIWKETSAARNISFFYNVSEAGSYELVMVTPEASNKTCDILVDGVVAVENATLSSGQSKVHFDLTAGNHIITIDAKGGSTTAFALHKVQLVKYVAVTGLELDLSGVTTEVEYDGIVSYSNIKVTAKYSDGNSKELTSAEFKVVEPADFDTTVPGTYTFTVVFNEDNSITKTFDVVVKAEEVIESSSSEPVSETSADISEITSAPTSEIIESSTPSGTSSESGSSSGGCGGSIAASAGIISIITLVGAGLLLSKKKEEK